jgi:predicted transcriptional regulator
MRDYTDMMNLTPAELVAHALECAKVGVLSIALVEALAVQLKDTDDLCEKLHQANAGLQVDLDEALDARDEWQGLAEQLNGVVKEWNR